MPKFAVMVECMVPQFTLVIVECDDAEQIEEYANQEKKSSRIGRPCGSSSSPCRTQPPVVARLSLVMAS